MRQTRKLSPAGVFALFWVLWVLALATPGAMAAGKETTSSAARPEISFIPKRRTGDYGEMVKKKKIRVLVVYSKTFFFVDKGQTRGLTHDAMREFEKFINQKNGAKTVKVKVIFIPVKRDELFSKLAEGYGDIAAANLTITSERKKLVGFSEPFASGVSEVIVTGADHKKLQSADDLSGKEVYVRKSSSYYESLLRLNSSLQAKGKAPVSITFAEEVFEDEDLVEMVNAGLISAIVMDSHKAGFWSKILTNIKVHPDAKVRVGGKISWAIRKDSPQLERVINEFVAKNKKGTLMGNMLINRYLKNTKYVKNATSQKEMEKFYSMVQLFKTYAKKYDFDFLMLAAQGYQESGLDQEKRSPAGAIGVMQVLKSTAKDPVVNIPEIHLLDKNIHAGTKYMRFLFDRYYKDAPMSEVDKMLFSFASYNAGPAKVRQIRKKTKELQLDPNVWFNNAEMGAARIIGRETVQYVANIYKYFISYKLAFQHHRQRKRLSENPPAQ